MPSRRTTLALGLATSLFALGLAGPASAAGLAGAPKPFDAGGVKLALIVYLSGGDYYQNYEAGVKRQAEALGIELRTFEGRQKPDEEREQIRQAINLGVNGIIIAGGKGEAVQDVVQEAIDAGIKIVTQNITLPQPEVIVIDQDESKQLDLVLNQAVQDNGDTFKAGYIYVEGFPALDKRDKAWTAFKATHPKVTEVARWGTVDDTPAQTVANQTGAVFKAHPDISVLFTDVRMSGSMDGVRLANQARLRWPPVKIIVTSGLANLDMQALPDDSIFLSKPYAPEELACALSQLIGGGRPHVAGGRRRARA